MIQGENKQWYIDEAHPAAMAMQAALKKRKMLIKEKLTPLNVESYFKQQSPSTQKGMTQAALNIFKQQEQNRIDKEREVRKQELLNKRKSDIDKLKSKREYITNRQANIKHNEDLARLRNPNLYKAKQFITKDAYNKVGSAAGVVGSKISSVIGGFKNFIVSQSKQQASLSRKQQAQINKQRKEYIKFQQRMAIARQKNMIKQQRQQQVRQQQMQRPYQMSKQMQNQIYKQQLLLRQQQAAEQEKKRVRVMTPGFYNPQAEHENPYGLRSRYKMNFGQNIFSNLDPENQKVFNNGKYKWRAD